MSEVIAFPEPDYEDLGDIVAANLRAAIAFRRVPQGALGERLGMSQQAVSDRLRGRVRLTLTDVGRLADLLGMDPRDLMVRHEGLEPPTRWFGASDAVVIDLAARRAA